MTQQPKKKHNGKLALGASIAALTVGAIAYFLVGPDGKRNRKKLTGWVIKMKGEIVEKLEQTKQITQPVFDNVVNQVANKYKKIKNISPADVEEAVKEMKKQWKSIAKESSSENRKSTKKSNA